MLEDVNFCELKCLYNNWCIQNFWWGLSSQNVLNLILLHCWKRLLRHFPDILSLDRLLFFAFLFFSGARVWAPIPDTQNQNLAGYITEITCKSKVSVCYTWSPCLACKHAPWWSLIFFLKMTISVIRCFVSYLKGLKLT